MDTDPIFCLLIIGPSIISGKLFSYTSLFEAPLGRVIVKSSAIPIDVESFSAFHVFAFIISSFARKSVSVEKNL